MDADDQKLIEEWLRARGWEQRGKDFFVQPGVEGTAHFVSILQASRDLPALIRAWNESQWTRIEPGCKMPAGGERILVYTSYGVERTGAWRGEDGWYVDELLPMYARQDIVSWRPMPAAPKEDGDA